MRPRKSPEALFCGQPEPQPLARSGGSHIVEVLAVSPCPALSPAGLFVGVRSGRFAEHKPVWLASQEWSPS